MERLATVRARLQEWERTFVRLHGRRPAKVRWELGSGQGQLVETQAKPVADKLLS